MSKTPSTGTTQLWRHRVMLAIDLILAMLIVMCAFVPDLRVTGCVFGGLLCVSHAIYIYYADKQFWEVTGDIIELRDLAREVQKRQEVALFGLPIRRTFN